MAKRNATSSDASSFVTKPNDGSAPPSSKTAKRRRMCVTQSYKSPLVHLRKFNRRCLQTTSDDLDDSVIVLEEVMHNPASLADKKKQTVSPDESVIILSDNEESETEKETNVQLLSLRTVVENDLSGENSAPVGVLKGRRNIEPRVKTKTTVNRFASLEKKKSLLGLSPKSDTVELESISIDSEDENTIPNDDSSRSHPGDEIIIIENSGIEITSFSTVSPSRAASRQENASAGFTPRKEFQTAAEQFASLRLAKNNHTCGKCPAFCIDTKGDPSLALPCSKNKNTLRRETNRITAWHNHNWAAFLENVSSENVAFKKSNIVENQADEIDSYRRVQTSLTNASPKSSLPNESTVVANEIQGDGMGSCQREEATVTNGFEETSHLHKVNSVLNQPKTNVIGSSHSGKTTVTNGSLKTPPPKEMKAKKRCARANWNFTTNQPSRHIMGSYYTEQTVVNLPGSLREIIIDGCNIATQYTKGKYFSEEGLKLVIDYFALRGHTVKAFVPQHVRSMKNVLLERLYSDGIVVFTPSRQIGHRRISSYDDRYILDYAAMSDGIVVSQDQYRDLYMEKPVWRRIIEERLLVPTFVGKCVMFPEDPLGRHGPTLDEFLRH